MRLSSPATPLVKAVREAAPLPARSADIFTVNQHNAAGCAGGQCCCGSARPLPPPEWWSGAFKDAIAAFGHVIAVLDPWDAPVPLTRAWCLWELLCSVEGKTRLEVTLSPAQAAAFESALTDDFDVIAASLSRVDARQSTAWLQSDRDTIFAAVEAGCGFTQLNAAVHGLLRDWLADSGRAALGKLPKEQRGTLPLISNLARLLRDQGRLADAEPLYLEALDARRKALGDRHPDTLTSINGLALLLRAQGRLGEAEPLYLEALVARRETLGDRHAMTLTSINNLALLLSDLGRLGDAEPLYLEALAARRETLGDRHPKTLVSINNLALLLSDLRRWEEAEPLYIETLTARRETLGDRHPKTLTTINNLANLLRDQGRPADAEPLYLEALAARRETLGDRHPDTLTTISGLTLLLKAQGRLVEAEPLLSLGGLATSKQSSVDGAASGAADEPPGQ